MKTEITSNETIDSIYTFELNREFLLTTLQSYLTYTFTCTNHKKCRSLLKHLFILRTTLTKRFEKIQVSLKERERQQEKIMKNNSSDKVAELAEGILRDGHFVNKSIWSTLHDPDFYLLISNECYESVTIKLRLWICKSLITRMAKRNKEETNIKKKNDSNFIKNTNTPNEKKVPKSPKSWPKNLELEWTIGKLKFCSIFTSHRSRMSTEHQFSTQAVSFQSRRN